ncbi:MAG: pseudouridine synthase [Chitinivibrionales bacterium]|nr:pseudouridine synthase [Chitinivibrionales bacterium]MBD3395636.1 pseudouridine synthase [Chitinivibrionales bacterium]
MDGADTDNPVNPVRLNRYLAQCGLGSRRECDRLIAAGSVAVNGTTVKELGTRVDLSRDTVTVAGKRAGRALPLQYVACHKSRGIMVTAKDPQGRETVYDALGKKGFNASHLKYVGRLDRDSEGLLLMTNDGDLVHALTHPRFHIKKSYLVRIERKLLPEHAGQMTGAGVRSNGQTLTAGKVSPRETEGITGEHWYVVDLYEGKNRQIRRMFESFGYEIIRLKRTQFGTVKLGSLRRGSYRFLEPREIAGLRRLGHAGTRTRTGKGKGRGRADA